MRLFESGAEGTRTPDFLRAKEALSQLSYSPSNNADSIPNGVLVVKSAFLGSAHIDTIARSPIDRNNFGI